MLHKTRGIVFHVTSYSESSVIAKIYTERFGLQSYLVNGVRNKKSKIKSNILQSLSLLDLVVYHKERGGLQRIKEIRQQPQFTSIPFDVMKSSLAFFMNEVLYKAVKEEEENQPLFDFISNALQSLDLNTKTNSCFHLHFLVQLTKYLGFFPHGSYSSATSFFDLQEGTFCENQTIHPYFIASPASQFFSQLANQSLADTVTSTLSVLQKRAFVEKLLQYYSLHIAGFGNIHSNKVLEEVWN